MKIVIDIPDEYAEQFYKNKCKGKFDSLATNEFGYVLRKAFEDATPLPEHHGDLIDRDNIEVLRLGNLTRQYDKGFDAGVTCMVNRILDAPTIIEGSDSE